MLDQLSKNITRCGLSNSTLNYLRVSVWEEVGTQLCSWQGAQGGHALCSQLPGTWLPWGAGRQRVRLCKRDLADGLQSAVGQWVCWSPQAPSLAWVSAAQTAA